MLGNMAGEAASRVADKSQALLRGDTRAAILKGARELVDKGGIDTLSLGAVATETGFAPPTVYAYFSSKNDLLVATVANDLADLARAMQDVYPFPDAKEPTGAKDRFVEAGPDSLSMQAQSEPAIIVESL